MTRAGSTRDEISSSMLLRVARVSTRRPVRLTMASAPCALQLADPVAGAAAVPGDDPGAGRAAALTPGQHDDVVAASDQAGGQGPAEVAGASGDHDAGHHPSVPSMT
jgi:hypothetical protein